MAFLKLECFLMMGNSAEDISKNQSRKSINFPLPFDCQAQKGQPKASLQIGSGDFWAKRQGWFCIWRGGWWSGILKSSLAKMVAELVNNILIQALV